MKRILKKIFIILFVITLNLFTLAGCVTNDLSNYQLDDIVILYTNDIHCELDGNIKFSNIYEYKNNIQKKTPNVTLVDLGDAVQGDVIGSVSKGEYMLDIMNKVGYDLAILGNHEFDYGMEQLKENINRFNGKYLGCNFTYTGQKENALSQIKPYEIVSYSDTKVAYIGVTTPYTTASSSPAYFMENGEFVYGFSSGNNGEDFYNVVQKNINECKQSGADYIILLTHLGDGEEFLEYSSASLIENTTGVDAVLDAHAHNQIPSRYYISKDGKDVLLSSTGTKLATFGQLVITRDGLITTSLISKYDKSSTEIEEYVKSIKSLYEGDMNKVVAKSLVDLNGYSTDGIRLVRIRETNIGNLIADAYRIISGADIGFVNGGGVRADIKKGDVTYADIISVNPYGNMICVVEATGQQILDALEVGCSRVKGVISENGNATGEYGGFLNVSGLKYTIDTSIESTVIFDENNMFVKIDGARRVKNVYVLNQNLEYELIDPNKTYTVASHNYLIKSGGDGINIFMNNKLILDEAMSDYQVVINYIVNNLNGTIDQKYESIEGRIIIE